MNTIDSSAELYRSLVRISGVERCLYEGTDGRRKEGRKEKEIV